MSGRSIERATRRAFLCRLGGFAGLSALLAACRRQAAPTPAPGETPATAATPPAPGPTPPRAQIPAKPRNRTLILRWGGQEGRHIDWELWNGYAVGANHQNGLGILYEPLAYYSAFADKWYPWLAED